MADDSLSAAPLIPEVSVKPHISLLRSSKPGGRPACLTTVRLAGILAHVPDAATGFSSSAIRHTLLQACAQAGPSSDRAELLRLGENAIYQLADAPVVVRIARSADRLPRVQKELCVARWLAGAGVPAVRVDEKIDQPLLVDGHPVTFWRMVTGGAPAPTHVDLARLLAAFHQAQDCPCQLPGFDPLTTSKARLVKATDVADRDRDFLVQRCADMNEQLRHLAFALPTGPIHGDAHVNNLLTDHGQAVLLDFESPWSC